MKFIQTKPAGGDCTAPYEIVLDKQYTVGEFISEILATQPNEWGKFNILRKGDDYFNYTARSEYRYGKMLDNNIRDYLSCTIDFVKSQGGWSLMDYSIRIKE